MSGGIPSVELSGHPDVSDKGTELIRFFLKYLDDIASSPDKNKIEPGIGENVFNGHRDKTA